MLVASAWHHRNLHHVKKLQPLDHYLHGTLPPAKRRENGARKVRKMFEAMAAKKGLTDGAE